MNTKILLLTSVAAIIALNGYGQRAGSASPLQPAGGVGSTVQPIQPNAPGGTQRGAIPSGVRVPAGQNSVGFITNQFLQTNQFGGITTQFLIGADQGLIATNQLPGSTNVFQTNLNGNFTPNSRGFSNVTALVAQDRAVTPADRAALIQIHRMVGSAFAGRTVLTSVHFQLQRGVATAVGVVSTLEEKQRIIQIVQSTPGVAQVVDQVQVRAQSGATPSLAGPAVGTNQFGIFSTNRFGTNLTPTSRSNAPNRVLLPPTP